MDELIIDDHAYKHGLTEVDIRYAWTHFLRKRYRSAPHEGQILALGCDASGRLIQLVAIEKNFGVLVYHAMTPPTNNALIELGMIRR